MARQILWVRACLLVIALLIVGISAGCIGPDYRHNDPSPTGTFYPNACVTVRGREANAFMGKSDIYTICQPVKISEVAIATYPWQPENPGEHEVALLEFSDASVYVWTSTLRAVGRVQYDGYETAYSRTWRNVTGFFTGVFWGLINAVRCLVLFIVFGAFVLLVRIFGR